MVKQIISLNYTHTHTFYTTTTHHDTHNTNDLQTSLLFNIIYNNKLYQNNSGSGRREGKGRREEGVCLTYITVLWRLCCPLCCVSPCRPWPHHSLHNNNTCNITEVDLVGSWHSFKRENRKMNLSLSPSVLCLTNNIFPTNIENNYQL